MNPNPFLSLNRTTLPVDLSSFVAATSAACSSAIDD
jgi:hypothetical protein